MAATTVAQAAVWRWRSPLRRPAAGPTRERTVNSTYEYRRLPRWEQTADKLLRRKAQERQGNQAAHRRGTHPNRRGTSNGEKTTSTKNGRRHHVVGWGRRGGLARQSKQATRNARRPAHIPTPLHDGAPRCNSHPHHHRAFPR